MRNLEIIWLPLLLLAALQAMGQQAMLTEPMPQTNHQFGRLVALQKDFAAVMTLENQPGSSIYVYRKGGSGWKTAKETAQLTTSTGVGLYALAADDGIIVAGAPADVVNGVQTGSVYVWVEPPTGWTNMTETAILSTSDGQAGGDCGTGVAVAGHGEYIVTGCPGWNNLQGKAYIFVEPAQGWVSGKESFQLTASDGQVPDQFGYGVSMSGPVIVIGAPNKPGTSGRGAGALYVFQSPPSGWQTMTQTAELTIGISGAQLGISISLGANAVVSLYGGSSAGNQTALWQEPDSGWQDSTAPTAILTTSENYTQFVPFIQGNRVAIGANAWHKKNGQKVDNGAVFIYNKPPTGWTNMTESYELKAKKFAPPLSLGISVALQGKELLSGALTTIHQKSNAGAAYLFAVK